MNDWAKVGIVLFVVLNWVGFLLVWYYSTEEFPIENYSCAELKNGTQLMAKGSILKETYYSNYTIEQEIISRCLELEPSLPSVSDGTFRVRIPIKS